MKHTLFIVLFTVIFLTGISAADRVTLFGEKDYDIYLSRYFEQIEEGTFSAEEMIAEVGSIRSNYVISLVSDVVSKLKVKRFFNRGGAIEEELRTLSSFKKKISRDVPTITTVEFTPTTVTQFTAKRGYIASPWHYPMTNWMYDWTSVEPFMLGTMGSKEDSCHNLSSDKSYSTWYRLYLTFDLSGLSYPVNITSAYIKIENVSYYWGKDEEQGMSVGYVTTSEISAFTDLDTWGLPAEATLRPYGYGTANERLVFSPLDGLIPYFLDSYAHGIVLNFRQLSLHDHGNWFYARRIWKRNIKLVIKYET